MISYTNRGSTFLRKRDKYENEAHYRANFYRIIRNDG